ncbi:MAG: hypothetical protein J0H55_12915 [Chitinophagaceae bacterium]|nr:hypothetical protein [Chitinophagaceae bacterium]
MRILICGSPQQGAEIKNALPENLNEIIFQENFINYPDNFPLDGLFLLNEKHIDFNLLPVKYPVFINEVIGILKDLNAPANVLRINGWAGFLQRKVWEVAGNISVDAERVAEALGRKLIVVKDEPGLISAKVIGAIINEAFYALNEKVSTKDEINIAMKLATNYPFGPFEWAEKIGYQKIHDLLSKLSETDSKYKPSFNPENIEE